VAIFSVTVPVDASGDPNPSDAPPEDIVQLTMRADATGITVGCSDPAKLPADMKICDARIPKKGNDYDTAALSEHLVTIKKTFTGAKTVVFVPDDDIKYSILVKILDVTRDYKQPDGTRLPLFPDVVMSGLVQLDGGVLLPNSTSESQPIKTLQVTIGQKDLRVEKEPIAQLRGGQVVGAPQGRIVALYNQLMKVKSEKHGKELDVSDVLIILCDQDTPYGLLKQVLNTSAEAGFPKFRMAVLMQ
jgi:biopolymer transport protein ExbD